MTGKLCMAIALLLALFTSLASVSCDAIPALTGASSQTCSDPRDQSEGSVAPQESEIPVDGFLKVHFIDVGQGDAIFVEFPDGSNMLIDCGERDTVGRVISFIDCLGYTKIDRVIATHPHTDHMGGMSKVFDCFDVGSIYMPDCLSDNASFAALLASVDAKGLSIDEAAAGVSMEIPGCKAEFLAPATTADRELNNCSAVLKLAYGGNSFLFTGDAEFEEEDEMLSLNRRELDCDVLKVGHHGSSSSSSLRFLNAVSAELAVISCAENSPYGHPNEDVVKRLNKSGVKKVYLTYSSGTLAIVSDGNALSVTEREQTGEYKWVVNLAGMKIHDPSCPGVNDMKEYNRAFSSRSAETLEKLGFTRCGVCKPEDQ